MYVQIFMERTLEFSSNVPYVLYIYNQLKFSQDTFFLPLTIHITNSQDIEGDGGTEDDGDLSDAATIDHWPNVSS